MNMDQNLDHYYAVIMAGGGGTRLWPLSRQSNPKQMLEIVGDKTLFQISVDRLAGLFPPERIFVVTIEAQAAQLQVMSPEIPVGNFIIEPMPKGTASVVGLAAIVLHRMDPDATMAILTADHFIDNESHFKQILKSAFFASRDDHLVTIGIRPTYPSTGYGYIQRGNYLDDYQGLSVYKANSFKEKPDIVTAEEYIKKGDHEWNSGMFIWKTSVILKEFRLQMPALYQLLVDISKSMEKANWEKHLVGYWEKIIPQTIDYGIMENAKEVVVIPAANLGWNDVGSWESLFEVIDQDNNGNIFLVENIESIKTKDSLVFSKQPDKLFVPIGLEGIIIIDTEDALLVCKREDAQDVREVVYRLKKGNKRNYL